MISGKPVCSATSFTEIPCCTRSCAVPPVESSSMPRSFSARANSTIPVLSETLSSARRTGVSNVQLLVDPEFFEFLAQGAAIDTEDGRGTALVSLHMPHHHLEQRLLDLAHHQFVQVRGLMTVQGLEIALQRLLGLRAQRHALAVHFQIAPIEGRRRLPASPGFLLCDHSPPDI